MKKFPSKAEQREQLAREVEEFLCRGGEIHEVPRGVSGRDADTILSDWRKSGDLDRPPPATRTDLSAVAAALDARRAARKKPSRSERKRPRKIIVYDDFGEPVREVWRED